MANSQSATKIQPGSTGYLLLGIGILLMIAGGVAVAPAIEAKIEPPGWAMAALFIGFFVSLAGGVQIYDSRPFPKDIVRAPQPLQLVKDEPWRKHTHLRYLEKLKDEVVSEEEDLVRNYERAKTAYEKLPHSSGRIEYNRWRRQKLEAEAYIPSNEKDISALKERIETIFSGNVEQELLTLKERILKFERNKQEYQRKIHVLDQPCNIQHGNDSAVEQCKRDRARKREGYCELIHSSDLEIIELQTHQEELKNYDFKNLWKGLGHSAAAGAGLAAVDKGQLQDFKDKAEIIKTIPSLTPNAPKPSPEEERRKKVAQTELRLKRHEQNKRDALDRILLGQQFKDLSSDDQDEYKREENSWNDTLRQDRDELRKLEK